jgi:hypothetical protein
MRRSSKAKSGEHREFKRGTASMAAPFRGFRDEGFSENFLGDGTCFWRDGS